MKIKNRYCQGNIFLKLPLGSEEGAIFHSSHYTSPEGRWKISNFLWVLTGCVGKKNIKSLKSLKVNVTVKKKKYSRPCELIYILFFNSKIGNYE